MHKKIFFDTNIIIDLYDTSRSSHIYSSKTYLHILNGDSKLFTSCDIITTIYYILSKNSKKTALNQIYDINQTLKVIEFSNKEISKTCDLMREDNDYKDLEDTMQYILAEKMGCDLIISNDKNFVSKEIELMSSEEFCKINCKF